MVRHVRKYIITILYSSEFEEFHMLTKKENITPVLVYGGYSRVVRVPSPSSTNPSVYPGYSS